jgi:predicted lipid carrier protein YhbT
MLEVSRVMAHVMDPELQDFDHELASMFRRYLTVRDLQLRVLVVAEQLGERCPKGKS